MKKILQWSLAITVLLQSVGVPAFAAEGDSVTIAGGRSLRCRSSLTATSTPENGGFSFQWISSEAEDGEYLPIIGATDSTYKLSTLDAGKYIGLTATNNADGETVTSEVKRTLTSLGIVSNTSFSSSEVNSAAYTPAKNLFYVDGQGFILLGEFHSDSSKYYVMTEEFYGDLAFDSNAYAKFDPETLGNIGYFLNNDFLTDGNGGKKLPDSIQSHIDTDHLWWTEKGQTGGDCAEDYSFTAGVSLLSTSEADVYYGDYGWKANSTNGGWWLRTQRGASSAASDNIMVMNEGNTEDGLCTDSYKLRPVFYLDRDFFEEVRIDPARTGATVAEVMKKNYSQSALGTLYTKDELIAMGIREKEFELQLTQATAQNGTILTAELKNLLEQEVSEIRYQWLYRDGEEYTPIYKETKAEYKVSTEDMNRTITVKATPVLADGTVSETLIAAQSYTVQGFGRQNRTAFSTEERQATKTTPAENLFTAGGQQFILLNEYADDASAFLIMTESAYGQYVYDEDNTEKFDPEDENNIGYFLNNTFLTEGNKEKKLPQSVIDHIDFDHIWWSEAGNVAGNCPQDYSFTAGIALIGKSEFVKYYGRFGWMATTGLDDTWWGRTVRTTDNGGFAGAVSAVAQKSDTGGDMWPLNANSAQYVRPIFYLDANFFTDVKISDAGENVIKAMRERYSVEELTCGEAGYTQKELEEMGVLIAPEAEMVTIGGNAGVNAKLRGDYSYQSEKQEGESEFGFEISSDAKSYSVLKSGVKEYAVTAQEAGKYIRFYCIVKDEEGISGEKAVSRALKITGSQDILVESFSCGKQAISESEPITPSFTLVNKTDSEQSAVCIIAAYDKEDRLVASDLKTYTLAACKSFTENQFSLSSSGAAYARVFLVDSLEKMNSLLGYEVIIR